ncbi:unnamed protein product [Lactuca virosa]|uniref:Uncharacterized protein n=1 Tax=Lactuca virosa TaxID=75947 RepID=A0AAU9M7I0_9ASTR|nr:unnamed protein product [Lactuca virosa]
MDENSSSDDDGDDDDEDDGEDDISDTIPVGDNDVWLEDGEIRSTDVEAVKESNLENSTSNTSNNARSPEVTSSPADVVMDDDDRGDGSDIYEELQGSGVGIGVHGKSQEEIEILYNNEGINVVLHADLINEFSFTGAKNVNVGPGEMSNRLLDNLDKSG